MKMPTMPHMRGAVLRDEGIARDHMAAGAVAAESPPPRLAGVGLLSLSPPHRVYALEDAVSEREWVLLACLATERRSPAELTKLELELGNTTAAVLALAWRIAIAPPARTTTQVLRPAPAIAPQRP